MSKEDGDARSISCTQCDWMMEVPPETPEELIRNDCPNCFSPINFNGQIEKTDGLGFDFLPPEIELEEIGLLEYGVNPKVSDLDKKTISGFVNRWSPMILIVQVMADMMKSNVELYGEEVLGRFTETSISYRKALRQIEIRHKIPRGSRLSDGFPDGDEKSIRRFARTYMGADPSKGSFTEGSGLGQEMGLVTLHYEKDGDDESLKLKLTEIGSEALKIKLHREPSLEIESHKAAGAGEVTLPRWMEEKDISRIFQIIEARSNAEYLWIKFLLQRIDASVRGLTISDLVGTEIERELTEGKIKRWFERGSDIDMVTNMNNENVSREEMEKRLEKKIIATIPGTLSRMKELSLIFQFKRARQTFYKATKSGRKWVANWDRDSRIE